MRLQDIFAGVLIWLATILMIMLSTYIPDLGVKFLNMAKPHILITIIIVLVYSIHEASRNVLPKRGKILTYHKLTLVYCIMTAILTQLVYFLTVSILPNSLVEEQIRLIENLFPKDVYELVIHVALTWILFAPVEELLFRGLVHRFISKALKRELAILVSSMLFAASHFSLIQMPVAFVVGVATASILDKTSNITNSIVVHAFNNTAALIISFIL